MNNGIFGAPGSVIKNLSGVSRRLIARELPSGLSSTPSYMVLSPDVPDNPNVTVFFSTEGPFTLQIPDGTVVGGNARGNGAVDLQTSRLAETQVASGIGSVIAGGDRNTASGTQATVGGGQSNTASGNQSTVAGGQTNTASSNQSTVAGGGSNTASAAGATVGGGNLNTASNLNATVAGGELNTASVDQATVAGGQSNAASGTRATVGGGRSNAVSGQEATVAGGQSNAASGAFATVAGGTGNTASTFYATVPGGQTNTASAQGAVSIGRNATSNIQGLLVQASSSSPGYAYKQVVLSRSSSDASPHVLSSTGSTPGATNQLVLDNNSACFVVVSVSALSANGDAAWWELKTGIKRGADAASTTLVGPVYETTYADAGLSAATVTLSADTTTGALQVTATGLFGVTIGWCATVTATQTS
jgi:hypothetical protein